jgi:hypothetical protein
LGIRLQPINLISIIIPSHVDIKSFYWKLVAGPDAKLNSTKTPGAEFIAPSASKNSNTATTTTTKLTFNLTTIHLKGNIASDLVNVFVKKPPTLQ